MVFLSPLQGFVDYHGNPTQGDATRYARHLPWAKGFSPVGAKEKNALKGHNFIAQGEALGEKTKEKYQAL